MTPEFCIAFNSQASGQPSDPEPAILHAKQRLLAYEATTAIPSLVLVPPLRLLLPPLLDPLKYALPILVDLQLSNHDLARRYAHRYARPIRLLFRNSLNVDDVFETVDGGHFALAAFVGAAGYNDFVVFADGDGPDLRGQRG